MRVIQMNEGHLQLRLPGELVADTLDELRAMLPAGLTRHDWSPFDLKSTVETWD